MSLAESKFGVPEPGNSPQDEPGHPENGEGTLTSPELILVASDEEAQRARDALTEVVPTDERILAEVQAARSLRVAAAAVVPAAPAPAPVSPPPERPAVAPVAPVTAPPPAAPVAEVAPTAPAAPPARRRARMLFAAALVPVAALGLAFGAGWNPFGGSIDTPSTVAATPTAGHVGTATSASGASSSHARPSTGPAGSTPAHTRASTTTPTSPTTHAGGGARTTSPSTPRTSATKHTGTTPPPRSGTTSKPKPPVAPPTITPSHVFAWPAAQNASFYLVSFMRDGKKVFEKRVTEPRLTLPGSFRFTAGNYRWTVVPATGTAGNPQYAPAIIDSKFVVA